MIVEDWGTTNLRLFKLAGNVVGRRADGPGILSARSDLPGALHQALSALGDRAPDARIILCGMVGSKMGIIDSGYVACPADFSAWRASFVDAQVGDLALTIAPGLACLSQDGVPDVMRGEEAQIFGAILFDPTLGIGKRQLVLPGTHSKWVDLMDGVVVGFRTYLTGELFALLRDHSTLIGADFGGDMDEGGFAAGLARARRGAMLTGAMFEARSAQLRSGRSSDWALDFLSGLLIGSELHDATALHPPKEVTVIGAPDLAARYQQACDAIGIGATLMDGNTCVVAGLTLPGTERQS